MSVKKHYLASINVVLSKLNIPKPTYRPHHVLPKDAQLKQAMIYTYAFCGQGNSDPHYRYHRYMGALRNLGHVNDQLSHVDIGCGSGCFSWAFLDWAEAWHLNCGQVKLFGIDHCPSMINAAGMIRDVMVKSLPHYPELHYHHDFESLLSDFRKNHHQNADSVVTMGHVLVQSQAPTDIHNFAKIILAVRKQTHPTRRCLLAAVDALKCSSELELGWNSLLKCLQKYSVTPIVINSYQSVRLASL